MKMNNGPTPNRQHMRQLGAASFYAKIRRNNDEDYPYDGNDPPIRAYRLHDLRLRKHRKRLYL